MKILLNAPKTRATLTSCNTGLESIMANLTISIDADLLKQARIRALQQGTSVNALLREYVEAYVSDEEMKKAAESIIDISRRVKSGSGPEGRTWTRDELYER